MAEGVFSVDQFSCPVCLELLKEPVTTPCGHSFCRVCINNCWDQEDQKGVYSCPECRHAFTPRPVLGKNTMLADVVEKLKETELHAAPSARCPAGPGDVECDFCTGRKLKAVKSCLACLASYCETHLQPHHDVPVFKKHKLIKASRRLQEQICCEHEQQLNVYCRTDQQCICMLCTMDSHKGHDAVSATAERAEKQKRLLEVQRKFQQKIQERENELEELKAAVESHQRSAQEAVRSSERIFTELIRCIERKRSEASELIRAQEKAAVSRAEEVLKLLEQEITELRRRNTELEELSHTEDHVHFLKSFQSVSDSPGSAVVPTSSDHPVHSFEEVVKSVTQLMRKVEELCNTEFGSVSVTVKEIQIIPPPEPQSRRDFLQYFCEFTLDPNTAHTYICLSEGNRVATCSTKYQPYPGHPGRFKSHMQVLCSESVSGRSYWEFEWSGDAGVCVAVSYKSISRVGESECVFGFSDKSWRLNASFSGYSFWHNKKETKLSAVSCSSCRVGVYVNHSAGTLAFYSVSDTMTLLHSVHTTFTQPLHPGFTLFLGSAIKLCDLTEP
ncbi:tripartite motif-containing protein 16-like [Salminus brasiliensis]|uniref:tripartite motif-containing protein 16-like n=1 Tax=Salminus brasiliensis TaxID=930266 RepID=UPI003B834C83